MPIALTKEHVHGLGEELFKPFEELQLDSHHRFKLILNIEFNKGTGLGLRYRNYLAIFYFIFFNLLFGISGLIWSIRVLEFVIA